MANVPGVVEVFSGFYYDSVTLAASTATAAEIRLFRDPQSSSKGLELTNMTEAGKLPAPYSMVVKAIAIEFSPNIAFADAANLYEKYVGRFTVGDHQYGTGPISRFPQGGGIFSAMAVGADSDNTAADRLTERITNGVPDPRALFAFEHPVTIGLGEPFGFDLKGTPFTTTATAVFLRIILLGDIQRGR